MQAADVVLWEFDVRTHLFYAENEPLNNCDPTQPLTIEDYKNIFIRRIGKKRNPFCLICLMAVIVCMKWISGLDCPIHQSGNIVN